MDASQSGSRLLQQPPTSGCPAACVPSRHGGKDGANLSSSRLRSDPHFRTKEKEPRREEEAALPQQDLGPQPRLASPADLAFVLRAQKKLCCGCCISGSPSALPFSTPGSGKKG